MSDYTVASAGTTLDWLYDAFGIAPAWRGMATHTLRHAVASQGPDRLKALMNDAIDAAAALNVLEPAPAAPPESSR